MLYRVSFLVRTLVIAAAGLALLLVGLSQANAVEEGADAGERSAQTEAGDDGPIVQATERISIPYGFSPALPLRLDDGSVVATGEGACTADNDITIVFTVTQPSTGESVSGVWNGTCTGDLQTWTNSATATPSPNFTAGDAEACASAETRDDEDNVTDTQEWCDDVSLAPHQVFLPSAIKP